MRSSWWPACNARSSARESHGGEGRIRAARFPARKSLEEFDFDHARGLKRDLIAHLGTLDFVTAQARTWCSSARPAPARPTSRSGWPSAPAKPGTGSCSPPPPNGSTGSPTPTTPAGCKPNWSGSAATRCWSIDEVGYIPFEPEAANLFFQLVSSRYERASLIVTSNKPFGRWGEVFGDDVVAAAMIDRLVHHAEVDRPQRRQLPAQRPRPRPRPRGHHRRTLNNRRGSTFNRRKGVKIQPSLTTRFSPAAHANATTNRRRKKPYGKGMPQPLGVVPIAARRAGPHPSFSLTSGDRSGHSQSHHGSEHKEVVSLMTMIDPPPHRRAARRGTDRHPRIDRGRLQVVGRRHRWSSVHRRAPLPSRCPGAATFTYEGRRVFDCHRGGDRIPLG